MPFVPLSFPPPWRAFLVAAAAFLAACGTAPEDSSAPTEYWSVEGGAWLTPAAVAAAVAEADYLLLGEIHDNAAHHLGQAQLLRAFPGDGVAVGFEQLD